jgi:hypothetical protein
MVAERQPTKRRHHRGKMLHGRSPHHVGVPARDA